MELIKVTRISHIDIIQYIFPYDGGEWWLEHYKLIDHRSFN